MNSAITMRIAFYTLGCKLNQYESKYLEETATLHGYTVVPFSEQADIYIINTCTVTAKSDLHARNVIRRAKKTNQSAQVVVTGCYAQRDPGFIKSIKEVDMVLGNPEKENLFEFLDELQTFEKVVVVSPQTGKSTDTFYPLTRFSGYTRAFMKIQDGCNAACAYCIVPSVRGASRSLDSASVTDRFRRFIEAGYREIVLTGIHIGKYGLDLAPATNLHTMLSKLVDVPDKFRIRLSSMEPPELTDEMIGLFGQTDKLCRHLHIPLQSGDETVLKSMKRPYTTGFYRDLVYKLNSLYPDMCIGADVITGFPGESDRYFENTYAFIESLPISYLHVFSFSPRPGTAAFNMDNKIPKDHIKRRTQSLRKLSRQKYMGFRSSLAHTPLQTLVYSEISPVTGLQQGLSSNYIHVFIKGSGLNTNEFYDLRIRNIQSTATLTTLE